MQLRPPVRGDAEAVLAVMVARDIADIGHPDVTLDDVLADWDSPAIDPARDCFVAEDAGGIHGYAFVDDRAAMVFVHPEAEGAGIGTMLREAVERRAAERGMQPRQVVPAGNVRALEHLAAAGYQREHVYMRMRADDLSATPPVDPSVPVRRFDVEAEGEAVHALLEAAFAEIPGDVPETYDTWRAAVISKSDPAFRLAVDDPDGLAGAVVGERWEEGTGYVSRLGVHGRARGRGYGRALLLAILDAFRGAGLTSAELSVHGDNAPATALYESVGMRPAWRQERWVKR